MKSVHIRSFSGPYYYYNRGNSRSESHGKLIHFMPLVCYPLKTSENYWFSDVFRGYRKRPLAWNRLTFKLFVGIYRRPYEKLFTVDFIFEVSEIKFYFQNLSEPREVDTTDVIIDDEVLPFDDNKFDLVVSSLR